jgi:hypothetical protein
MTTDRQLHPGGALGLSLSAGTEVVCTGGLLYLTATGPWLGEAWARRALPAGQAWRAGEAQWVQLEAGDGRARFRVVAPPPAPAGQPCVTAPRWSSSVPGMCRS